MSGKSKIRVGGSNTVSLAFTDEMLDENAEIDLLGGIDDQQHVESAAAFNRRKSTVRGRRSSIGIGHKPSGSLLNDEQNANLAAMYKTVIQLSTEGKLNEKNSWKYDLIDHMGKLIRDDHSKGVNFQKASCTLDASVKIYSNRVDDTYSTSHRVLESLSRNNNEVDANILGEETVPHRVKPVKVGTKSSSTRLNIAQTIEKNPEAINAVKLEHDYAFDPMFHKISKAFDEGGSKGMLLYNMRLSTKSSALSFIGKGVEQRWNAAEDQSVQQHQSSINCSINMRDLVNRSRITMDSISGQSVCPKLSEYRRFVNISSSKTGVIADDEIERVASEIRPITFVDSKSTSKSTTENLVSVESPERDPGFYNGDGDYVGGDYDGEDYGGDNYLPDMDNVFPDVSPKHGKDSTPPGSSSSSIATDAQRRVSIVGAVAGVGVGLLPATEETTKFQWTPQSDAAKKQEARVMLEKISIDKSGDYSFFKQLDESDDNSWAGAPHWKKLRPKRNTGRGNDNMSDTSSITDVASIGSELDPKQQQKPNSAKSKKASTKKDIKNGGFELTLDPVDPSKFAVPSKVDTTIITKAAKEKAIAASRSLLLPTDEHLKVHDLCRLFLLSSVIVPPKKISNLIKGSATAANSSKSKSGKSTSDAKFRAKTLANNIISGTIDDVWIKNESGIAIIPSKYTEGPTAAGGSTLDTSEVIENIEVDYPDDVDDGGYYYPDNNEDSPIPNNFQDAIDKSPSNGNLLAGLSINQDNLVQAGRVVEKIEINYAKVSKRVDVHKLKGDVWSGIEQNLGEMDDHHHLVKPKAAPVNEELSFQKLVKDLSGGEEKQQQKDVSLAYYFICLLHLANENTLEIKGQEDMSDLKIKYDK